MVESEDLDSSFHCANKQQCVTGQVVNFQGSVSSSTE